jgi:hypothetical protein
LALGFAATADRIGNCRPCLRAVRVESSPAPHRRLHWGRSPRNLAAAASPDIVRSQFSSSDGGLSCPIRKLVRQPRLLSSRAFHLVVSARQPLFTGHRCPVVLARRDARSYARSPGQRPALKIDDYCSTGNRMRLRCRSCSPWNVLFHPQQRGSTLSANRAIRPHLGCGLILLFRMETCGHLESAHARKMGLDSQALRQARRACCGHCSAHFYCTTSLDTLSSFRNSARRADLLAAVTAATASTAAVTVRSRTLGNVGFTLAGNSSQLRLRFRRSALIRDSA